MIGLAARSALAAPTNDLSKPELTGPVKTAVTYEFDPGGNWTKEMIQRWTEKNGVLSLMETVVSRERQITYH